MTAKSTATPVDDSPMFAPVPAWERGKKRRNVGRRVAEPRSFAPSAAAAAEPEVDRLSDVDPVSSDFAAPPVYATRTRAKSSSAPIAMACSPPPA